MAHCSAFLMWLLSIEERMIPAVTVSETFEGNIDIVLFNL